MEPDERSTDAASRKDLDPIPIATTGISGAFIRGSLDYEKAYIRLIRFSPQL